MVGASLESKDISVKGHNGTNTLKFLCSYGGKIVPRFPDGKLRYVGGETRVLSVLRSLPFSEILLKFGELYGSPVSLRCQLPNEDLDALVSITSDEDLSNLIEEYERANQAASAPLKIRAFLSSPKSLKKISPPPSATSSVVDSAGVKYSAEAIRSRTPILPGMVADQYIHQISTPVGIPLSAGAKFHYHACFPQGNPSHIYLVHNGNHWQ